MTDERIECSNCGRANPSWAQVCRSCGVPIRPAPAGPRHTGPIPRDRDSLISIGAGLAAIVLAVVLGMMVSGAIPSAAPVADETETPEPSRTPRPTLTLDPSPLATDEATPEATPALIGTVAFGTGIDASTQQVTGATDTFGPGSTFCHSIQVSEPFGVDVIQEEILRVEEDGSLTEVQPRSEGGLSVPAEGQIAGFCATVPTEELMEAWGVGSFVLRDYRGDDPPELIAEGRFTLSR